MNKKEQTLLLLEKLKLQGMASMYKSILNLPVHEQITVHQAITQMAMAEENYRADKRTQMYLRMSKLRYDTVFEKVDCSSERNLTREQLLSLSDGSFIERSENILITGATGCGKSYLACAIGRQACLLGYKTLYMGMLRFSQKIQQSKLEGTFMKFVDQLNKNNLIIIDDFGLVPMNNDMIVTLLQILEDRYQTRSTVIVSQLPFNDWYHYINDKTLADAIMDRLAVSVHKFQLKGKSLRHKN